MKGFLRTYLPALICLMAGMWFTALKFTGHKLEFLPGDLGDGRFNNYLLEHNHRWFSGQLEQGYWDAPFMYPIEKVITYSDNLLGSAPIYSAFRFSGFDRERSFQLWVLATFILNFLAAWLFLFAVFRNPIAASAGAFVFAFSLSTFGQIAHVQTLPRYTVPLAFLMAFRFSKNLSPNYFLLTLLILVYQIYCGIYLGFLMAIPLAVFFIALFIYKNKEARVRLKKRNWSLKMAASVVVSLLALAPLLYPYLKYASKFAPSYKDVLPTIPTPESWFFSVPESFSWPFLESSGFHLPAFWNHYLFPGGLPTIAYFVITPAIMILLLQRSEKWNTLSPPLRIMLITGFICFFLFLRFGNFSLYKLIYLIPGLSAIRDVTRIVNIMLLFFGFSLAFILTYFHKNYRKWNFVLFPVLLFLLILDNYVNDHQVYRISLNDSVKRTELLTQALQQLPEGAVFSYEPDTLTKQAFVYQLDAMMAAQNLQLKTLNGYSGNAPACFFPWATALNAESRQHFLDGKPIGKLYVINKNGEISIIE